MLIDQKAAASSYSKPLPSILTTTSMDSECDLGVHYFVFNFYFNYLFQFQCGHYVIVNIYFNYPYQLQFKYLLCVYQVALWLFVLCMGRALCDTAAVWGWGWVGAVCEPVLW